MLNTKQIKSKTATLQSHFIFWIFKKSCARLTSSTRLLSIQQLPKWLSSNFFFWVVVTLLDMSTLPVWYRQDVNHVNRLFGRGRISQKSSIKSFDETRKFFKKGKRICVLGARSRQPRERSHTTATRPSSFSYFDIGDDVERWRVPRTSWRLVVSALQRTAGTRDGKLMMMIGSSISSLNNPGVECCPFFSCSALGCGRQMRISLLHTDGMKHEMMNAPQHLRHFKRKKRFGGEESFSIIFKRLCGCSTLTTFLHLLNFLSFIKFCK